MINTDLLVKDEMTAKVASSIGHQKAQHSNPPTSPAGPEPSQYERGCVKRQGACIQQAMGQADAACPAIGMAPIRQASDRRSQRPDNSKANSSIGTSPKGAVPADFLESVEHRGCGP